MKITKYIQRNCMGCGICHSADGINMIKDKKGFYFPEISKNQDINEESITYCPVFNYSSKIKSFIYGEIMIVFMRAIHSTIIFVIVHLVVVH